MSVVTVRPAKRVVWSLTDMSAVTVSPYSQSLPCPQPQQPVQLHYSSCTAQCTLTVITQQASVLYRATLAADVTSHKDNYSPQSKDRSGLQSVRTAARCLYVMMM